VLLDGLLASHASYQNELDERLGAADLVGS
jgi:uncharacterized protein (DUF3084 family)